MKRVRISYSALLLARILYTYAREICFKRLAQHMDPSIKKKIKNNIALLFFSTFSPSTLAPIALAPGRMLCFTHAQSDRVREGKQEGRRGRLCTAQEGY